MIQKQSIKFCITSHKSNKYYDTKTKKTNMMKLLLFKKFYLYVEIHDMIKLEKNK